MHKTLASCNLKLKALLTLPHKRHFGVIALSAMVGSSLSAQAAKWGASAGYNNPAGTSLGLNLISMGSTFGFEFGVGGLSADSSDKNSKGGLWGDADLKIFFAEKFRPYVEVGFATSFGGQAGEDSSAGFSAGSPFVGGGLMYQGSSLFGYAAVDYRINSKSWVAPVFGLGLQF